MTIPPITRASPGYDLEPILLLQPELRQDLLGLRGRGWLGGGGDSGQGALLCPLTLVQGDPAFRPPQVPPAEIGSADLQRRPPHQGTQLWEGERSRADVGSEARRRRLAGEWLQHRLDSLSGGCAAAGVTV